MKAILKAFYDYLKYKHYTRLKFDREQTRRFRRLLFYAWDHSKFYRDYYSTHQIKRSDLADIPLENIPLTNKEMFVKYCDDFYTDPVLKKSEIEAWLNKSHDPRDRYLNKYVILHTSGSSGSLGIFVYHKNEWTYASTLSSLRTTAETSGFLYYLTHRRRSAFLGATHGHFTGVTLLTDAAKYWGNVKLISILAPIDEIVATLNQYQPTSLGGYPTAIEMLCDEYEKGNLHTSFKDIFLSGEGLSEKLRKRIITLWPQAKILNLYVSTETIVIARKKSSEQPFVVDSGVLLELVNEENHHVMSGQPGRVVVSNLVNYTTPIIRYSMEDYAVADQKNGSVIKHYLASITGRSIDNLPIINNEGIEDFIHSQALNEFFVPDIKKFQFVSFSKNKVKINYTSDQNIDDNVRKKFFSILQKKNAEKSVEVVPNRVTEIPLSKGGKLLLVVLHPESLSPSGE